MQQSGGAPSVSNAPLFATVSFLWEHDAEPQQTFRVPIDATTTVKALAKNAMYRLNQQQKASSLGIREIYVGAHEVKLFIHDIVVQVVNLQEERVVLVVRDKSHPNRGDQTQPAPIIPEIMPSVITVEKSPSPHMTTDQQLDMVARQLRRRSKSPAPERSPSSTVNAVKSQSSKMPIPVAVNSPKPPGKQAKECYDVDATNNSNNSKLSPKKRPRSDENEEERVLTPEVAKVTNVSRLPTNQREEFISQKSKEGWGREAYRCFESNYTSDPDKLARELRKSRQKQLTPSDKSSTANSNVATVPRTIFADDSMTSSRSPLADASTNRLLFTHVQQDDEQRPAGWGVKAALYFDPSTYHDNPSKAKLDPAVLNEPIRARRSTRDTFVQ